MTDVQTAGQLEREDFAGQLDEIQRKLTENEALLDFLVGLKLGSGTKARARVGRVVKSADKARRYLPEHSGGFDAFDAQRATAYATVAIAEAVALVLERTLAGRER